MLFLPPKNALGLIDEKNSHDPKLEASHTMTSGERIWLSLNSNDTSKGEAPKSSSRGKSGMHPDDPHASKGSSKSEFLYEFMDEFQPLSERFEINRSTNIDRATFVQINNQAHDGSIDSAYFLGLIYVYGLGLTKPDYPEALRWFKEAAMKGHKEAQCALGMILYNGMGSIGQDRKTAMVSKCIRFFTFDIS
jgi:FOG: TPR repeat, SEL1 subfamily